MSISLQKSRGAPSIAAERPRPHILIIIDDQDMCNLLYRFLNRHDFRVTIASDGHTMAQALADWAIDLIVLDRMLPGDDGLTLCNRVRRDSHMPIIMLTAMGEDEDRIAGLVAGADDCVAKPFNPRELVARIKTILRRGIEPPVPPAKNVSTVIFRFADFELEQSTRTVWQKHGMLPLTAGEYDLLLAFVEHPGRVLNRDQLLDFAHGRAAIPFDRAIDVMVGRLRKKIETNPKSPALIKTVRGSGYIFTATVLSV